MFRKEEWPNYINWFRREESCRVWIQQTKMEWNAALSQGFLLEKPKQSRAGKTIPGRFDLCVKGGICSLISCMPWFLLVRLVREQIQIWRWLHSAWLIQYYNLSCTHLEMITQCVYYAIGFLFRVLPAYATWINVYYSECNATFTMLLLLMM